MVRSGYKQTEVGEIPDDWDVQTGEQMTTLIGKGGSPRWQGFEYSNTGMLFVTSENVRDGFLDIQKPKYLPLAFHEKLKRTKLQKYDILVNLVGASIGRSCQIQQDLGVANVNQAVAIFRVKEKHNSTFVACCFQASVTIERILEMQVDAARPNISLGDLRHFHLPLPPLPEQQAIAEALSDVDNMIDSLEKLIAKKRDIKTATMQQLLTGKTRLPGFGEGKGYKQTEVGEIPEGWTVSSIGNDTIWLSGGTPSRENAEFWMGTIPWISGSTLKQIELNTSDQFLTEEAVIVGSKMAPVDSTLVLVRGSALHNEIRAGLVVSPVCFNQDVKALIPQKCLFPKYLTYYILGMGSRLLKLVSSAGNSAGVLDTELVKNFVLLKPKQTKEQQAIASVLTDIDKEIENLHTRLNKTKSIKQGMMQELLTGRTRLL